ncbi:hypothetical protein CFP56_042454 [Quercus suber]|uniref:Uncharacterized protein n=1 Tax=Quercus suber TaxID=58331 RepID=A0AAW0ITX1_QUESU
MVQNSFISLIFKKKKKKIVDLLNFKYLVGPIK